MMSLRTRGLTRRTVKAGFQFLFLLGCPDNKTQVRGAVFHIFQQNGELEQKGKNQKDGKRDKQIDSSAFGELEKFHNRILQVD
jgi:hypothetical protein